MYSHAPAQNHIFSPTLFISVLLVSFYCVFPNLFCLELISIYIYIFLSHLLTQPLLILFSLSLLHLYLFSSARSAEMADFKGGEDFYGSQDHEATSVAKKYGGLAPKKKPLISKDHERAFFDSADWALCKQGAGVNQKSTTAIETLRPKLQRTPHQQLPPRRPACTSGRDNLGE